MAIIGLDEIVIDCADPTELARFWGALFAVEPVFRSADWTYIESPLTRTRIAFQQVPESKSVKNRVHLDVEVDDIAAEADRLVGLGARVIGTVMEDEYGRFQVMQDPEGNEFCLIR